MLRTRVFGGLLAAVLLGMPLPADAQRDFGRADLRGTVKAVDTAKATLTVAIGGGRDRAAEEKTFSLAKDVEVCVVSSRGFGLFKEAKLSDIAEGTVVGLSLSADKKSVDSIVADEPVVRGVVKSADAKSNTLVLTTRGPGREAEVQEKSYALSPTAEVVIDDGRGRRFSLREGTLKDLGEGTLVTAWLSLDGKQVRSVMAEGGTVSGVLKSIDAEKRSVTLTVRPPRGDDAGEEKTVTLAKEALVLIDDGRGRRLSLKESKLADIPVGSTAMVQGHAAAGRGRERARPAQERGRRQGDDHDHHPPRPPR
jgi:hypothetical protein